MTATAKNQETATNAFLAAKAKFDSMVKTLAEISEDNFSVDPDDIDWVHVETVNQINAILAEITGDEV